MYIKIQWCVQVSPSSDDKATNTCKNEAGSPDKGSPPVQKMRREVQKERFQEVPAANTRDFSRCGDLRAISSVGEKK